MCIQSMFENTLYMRDSYKHCHCHLECNFYHQSQFLLADFYLLLSFLSFKNWFCLSNQHRNRFHEIHKTDFSFANEAFGFPELVSFFL